MAFILVLCSTVSFQGTHLMHIFKYAMSEMMWLTLNLLIESLSVICWVMMHLSLYCEALLQGYCQKCVELHT
jgi:hypothetical protein